MSLSISNRANATGITERVQLTNILAPLKYESHCDWRLITFYCWSLQFIILITICFDDFNCFYDWNKEVSVARKLYTELSTAIPWNFMLPVLSLKLDIDFKLKLRLIPGLSIPREEIKKYQVLKRQWKTSH